MKEIDFDGPLWKKAAIFTDIHFGEKLDSRVFNEDCLRYLDWFSEQVIEHDCDTILFLGDWHHHPVKIQNDTKWYSIEGINKLKALKKPIYWILGNHDLWFKNSRDIHSLPFLENDSDIILINEITRIGDVLFCPWLVGSEFNIPADIPCKYVFGHFEFPTFLMNNYKEMEEGEGGIHADFFYQCERVFSGHFHKRQSKNNSEGIPIDYIGNCFPHNYNDVDDHERGCLIHSWDQEPLYINWDAAPNYNIIKVSQLLSYIEDDSLTERFNEYSYVTCYDDVGLDYESNIHIKEVLQMLVRDFKLHQMEETIATDETEEENTEIENVDVDTLVINELTNIDSDEYDPKILIELYKNASK